MNLHNYEKATDYEVQKWIDNSELELTPYQKQRLRDYDVVRLAPFYFIKPRKRVTNIWLRLSIILFPPVWILILISLPFNFILTGKWGYGNKTLKWFDKWVTNINV